MVQDAFRTSIHKYVANGVSHWANSTDPSIPTALGVYGADHSHGSGLIFECIDWR